MGVAVNQFGVADNLVNVRFIGLSRHRQTHGDLLHPWRSEPIGDIVGAARVNATDVRKNNAGKIKRLEV